MFATHQRKRAFSLIEIMIALTIMSVMLTIILIPLRLGFDSLHVGQARSGNQTAIQGTLSQIEKDLRRAVYVFPNTEIPGITDQKPFTATPGTPNPPYTRGKNATDTGSLPSTYCPFSQGNPWSNTSRIDMILSNGSSGQPGNIVTYYPRRVNINQSYDPIDNPIVLFRAEYFPGDKANITADHSGTCPSGQDFKWLAHNVYGEADLTQILPPTTSGGSGKISHTLATPRGLGLVASRAFRIGNGFPTTGTVPATTEAPFKADSSFTCLDTNGDGKIDRVNISLAIASFDASNNDTLRNNQPSGQSLRAERIVDLPNIQ